VGARPPLPAVLREGRDASAAGDPVALPAPRQALALKGQAESYPSPKLPHIHQFMPEFKNYLGFF